MRTLYWLKELIAGFMIFSCIMGCCVLALMFDASIEKTPTDEKTLRQAELDRERRLFIGAEYFADYEQD